MQRIFRKQGSLFLPLLAKHKGLFVEAGTYAGWSCTPEYAKPGTMLYEAIDEAKLQRILDRIHAETSEDMRATLHTTSEKAYGAGIESGSDLAAGISFSVHHPAAVEWLESHAAEMVTEINSTTRDFIGNVVTQGVDEGWSYNRMAREIKGRYEEFAVGKPQAHIQSRAHLVAVTESHKAYGEGHRAGVAPLLKVGLEVEHSWNTMQDDLVSEGCQENEEAGWIPIDDTFPSGDQTEPRFPGCLPGGQRVIADGVLGATKRFYDGGIVIIETASGNKLTCTPNHPILTREGWVAAGLLDVGSNVISAVGSETAKRPPYVNEQHGPTMIEEVARAFGRSGNVSVDVVKVAAPNFHGDGDGSDVAVVFTDRSLQPVADAAVFKHPGKRAFIVADAALVSLAPLGHPAAYLEAVLAASCSLVGSASVSDVLCGGALGHHQLIRLKKAADRYTHFLQTLRDRYAAGRVSCGQRGDRLASFVAGNDLINRNRQSKFGAAIGVIAPSFDTNRIEARTYRRRGHSHFLGDVRLSPTTEIFADNVVNIERREFHGHVFNLQTERGYYIAEGIITHNCRCNVQYQVKPIGTEGGE